MAKAQRHAGRRETSRKSSGKALDVPLDVLVLGEHPATYLAAALLREKSGLRIVHATIPGETAVDRLTIINPALFGLHPLLEPLRRKLQLTSIYGVRFFADDAGTRSEFRTKTIFAHIGSYKEIRGALMKAAADEGVEFITPKSLEIRQLDEAGLTIGIGKTEIRPKVLVLGGILPQAQQNMLGLPEAWGPQVVHRYTFLRLRPGQLSEAAGRTLMSMSLNLRGRLFWGWLLPGSGQLQLAVEQPVEMLEGLPPAELLQHWAEVLHRHGVLKSADIPAEQACSMDLPFAGALAHEGLANRTVLIGPAGGFYSASGEDIYPNCWSAIYAAEAVKKALKEVHLQDALQPYRQRWRTTLGDYLRGPQQNLRFLLPLVYRNEVMTGRLAESIVLGKSLVR